jgi:hypothetical protein
MMKATTKVSLTLPYGDWIALLRVLKFALGEMEDQENMRTSEKALLLADSRKSKELLLTTLAEKRARK